jgi:hypothetical protein
VWNVLVITATWANCRDQFSFDGAFVDLIAFGTGPAEWDAYWVALRSGPFGLRAYRDGEPIDLPETVARIFADREVASTTVSVLLGSVVANCHFFGGDLELDADSREIDNEQAFESVLGLMRFVAVAVKLPVFAKPEGGSEKHAFLRVLPSGQAEFLPPGASV